MKKNTKLKKILMIGPFPNPITGQSIANRMLLNGLKQNEYLVDYIDSNTQKEFNSLKIQGKFNLKKFFFSFNPILKGVSKILFCKYDIIYITPAQSYLGFMKYTPFIKFSVLKKTPCYLHFHGGFVKKMYDSLNQKKQKRIKKYFNKSTGIIVLGDSLISMFNGIVDNNKIFVCENGVEDEYILSKCEIKNKKEKIKFDDELKLLYLSNLMKTKGILNLMEACIQLKNKGIKFHLNIAGNIEPEIKKKIDEYIEILDKNVTYHGVVEGEAKRELLKNAHIFCLPTFYPNEGQPIAILEAMSNGCAIITTNQGGIQDIFSDKINGIRCSKESINIEKSILLCKKSIDKFIDENYKGAIKKYTKRCFINRIINIIEN